MAYAFDKVSDYFRRQKSGQRGNLERGTQGAPPPTAAAETLAKQAETSAEQGNADTSAFRANLGAGQSAAQKALYQPAEKQAQEWGSTQEAKAGEYKGGEQKKIEQRYQAYAPTDLAKIESGDQGAMGKAREQIGYTGTEMSWQPYQVQDAQLNTTSMLSGGVGGLQAALQRNRGGRYTGGMAALDASLLSGNRGAMQGLQQKLGDIYQGTREKKAALEQTDEQLAQEAKQRATGIAGTVRGALEARLPQLKNVYQQQVTQGAAAKEQQSREGVNTQDAMVQALMAQGLTGVEALDALGIGPNSADINSRAQLYMPGATRDIFMQDRDLNRYVVQGPQATYSQAAPTDYASIASVLGITPENLSAAYNTYGVDSDLLGRRAQSLANQYRYLTSIQGVAPSEPQTTYTYDPETGAARESVGGEPASDSGSDYGDWSTETVDMGPLRDSYQEFSAPGSYRDFGTIDTSDDGTSEMGIGAWGEDDSWGGEGL